MAWIPSLVSLVIGLLGQVGAAEWVAANPNVFMALATLGHLITAVTRSPIQAGK